MKTDFDVIVIGGGPAGCAAAIELVRKPGMSVLLLEKESVPRIKACAGGISMRAERMLKKMDLWEDIREHIYPIRGARIVTPTGRDLELSGDATASVMNRSRFDHLLFSRASTEGVKVRDSVKVDEVLIENGKAVGIRTGEDFIFSDAIIIANGAATTFREKDQKREYITTCTAWFTGVPFKPGTLEMIFDPKLSPHYGWLFPESEETCNIGLCVRQEKIKGVPVTRVYDDFLEAYFGERIQDGELINPQKVHPIIPSPSIGEGAPEGAFLVGDAGRMINAFTGEGISFAIESGMLAAEAAEKQCREEFSRGEAASWYISQLKKNMTAPLRSGRLLCAVSSPLLKLAGGIASVKPVNRAITRLLSKT